jgi:hypothetical protein
VWGIRLAEVWLEAVLAVEAPQETCLPTSLEETQKIARRGAATVQASIPNERHFMAV